MEPCRSRWSSVRFSIAAESGARDDVDSSWKLESSSTQASAGLPAASRAISASSTAGLMLPATCASSPAARHMAPASVVTVVRRDTWTNTEAVFPQAAPVSSLRRVASPEAPTWFANYDVRIALSRVDEFRAAAGIAGYGSIPTIAASGLPGTKGFNSAIWFGIFAPKGTDPVIIKKLNLAVNDVLKQPEVRERFVSQGNTIREETPEQFKKTVHDDRLKWAKVVKDAGFKAQ